MIPPPVASLCPVCKHGGAPGETMLPGGECPYAEIASLENAGAARARAKKQVERQVDQVLRSTVRRPLGFLLPPRATSCGAV